MQVTDSASKPPPTGEAAGLAGEKEAAVGGTESRPPMAQSLPDPPLARATALSRERFPIPPGKAFNRGSTFLRECLRLLVVRPVMSLPLAVAIVIQFALMVGLAWWAITRDEFRHPMADTLVGLAGTLISATILYLMRGLWAALLSDFLHGVNPTLGRAVEAVLNGGSGLMGMALISTGLRFFGRSLGLTMVRAWEKGSFMAVPVVVLERRGLGDSLSRGQFLSGTVLPIQVSDIAVGDAAGALAFFLVVPYMVALYAFRDHWAFDYDLALLLLLLLVALIAAAIALMALAETAYSTCLYLWARDLERNPEAPETRVPDPLVPALNAPAS
ncbi:MAG TPA: hypothetical protein VGO93_01360 [Candidatus Xenobia bacterium]